MNTIERHIDYLLSRNECLSLPGLGSFVYAYHPACFDTDNGVVEAPFRTLLFNSGDTGCSDLLVTSVARAEKLSRNEAEEFVIREIDRLKKSLWEKRVVRIGNAGELSLSIDDNSIVFTPYEDILSVDTVWLPQIALRQPENSTKVIEVKVPEYQPESSWHRIFRTAASIAVLIGFFFLVSTPIAIDDSLTASFFPEVRKMEAIDVVPLPDDQVTVQELNEKSGQVENTDYVKEAELEDIDVAAPTDSEEEILAQPDDNGRYCIIVASLATYDDAERFVSENSADNLQILAKDGRFRVYCNSYPTSAAAYAAVNGLSGRYPQAWVCTK